ncbi:MAG: sensor histidine kinase [Cyanobacteria bacterium J06614_10]
MNRTSNLLYQRYRSIALVVYAAVLFAGIVDWAYGGIGPKTLIRAPENLRFAVFVMAMVALVGIELRGLGRADFGMSRFANLFPFAVRFALFVTICLITDLNYSQILFLTLLLYGYLAISKRLSYLLAFTGVAILFGLDEAQISMMESLPSPQEVVSPLIPPGGNMTGRLIDRSMGSLIALLFTLLLARAMLQAIRAQQQQADLFASLETSHLQLKQYANRVAELAATEERNRLARDIHDSLGHHLAAINIQLEKANAYRQRDPQRAYEAVTYAQHTVQDALKEVRQSVNSLREEEETFSFHEALKSLVRRMNHSELTIRLALTGDYSCYSRLKQMTLYRVVQEGLTNVHKHAHASEVAIAINFDSQSASLKLADNGTGFDVAAWQKRTHKDQITQGLRGLQERLSLVGGTLSIVSKHSGTTLVSHVPQKMQLERSQLERSQLERNQLENLRTGQPL